MFVLRSQLAATLSRSLPKRPLSRPTATSEIVRPIRVRYATFRIPPPPNARARYQNFQTRRAGIVHLWQTSQGFRVGVGLVTFGAVGFYVSNLETVPVSGRRRFNVVSADQEMMMSRSMYESTLQQFGPAILPQMHPYTRMVKRVMKRLVPVSGLDDLKWEVFVIADDTMKNAFVIPGGKVFVFSGMLQIADTEPRLAAVLSHEISHTIAHHSAERLSKMFIVFAALWTLTAVIGGSDGGIGRLLLDFLFVRPGSRKQEAEADYIGLMLMATACYSPSEAVKLWERMEEAERYGLGGIGSPPQFLSTHPAHKTRIDNMRKWMPEALSKQAESDCAQTMDYANQFKKAFELQAW